MSVQDHSAPARFSDRVFRTLERVEHRRAVTKAEREAIYRLRYEAYTRGGAVPPSSVGRSEEYDEAPNCWIFGTYIDGELAATSRIHIGADENALLPSRAVFPDAIGPLLQQGRVIIDPTRRAARLDLSRNLPELAYIALMPSYLAAGYFEADFVLATVPPKHQPFYRRVFGCEPWSAARTYPGSNVEISCMGLDYRAQRELIETRYPFFRSTPAQREKLFGEAGSNAAMLRGASAETSLRVI